MIKCISNHYKRIYFFFITALIFISVFFSSALYASYSMVELEATPLEVPDVVNTVVWDNLDTGFPNDDDKQLVSIGFPFQFDTIEYSNLLIFTNGVLKFLPTDRMHRDYVNESLPTDEGDGFIAVYWDDLVDDAASSVTYGNLGVAPNRRFVVNWTNVRAYSNNLRYDFQVVLYENGDIRYRYNNNTSNGESATIGLEIDDGDFVQYSHNQVSVEVSFDLLFRNQLLALPTPILQYRLDEVEWDGSVSEVVDSSANGLNGRAFSGANTADTEPVLGSSIGTCNYGEFDGVNDYVEISDNSLLDFSNNFSVGVWIKIDSIPTSGLKTILSKDENYEFHVNSSGQINWWWRTEITNIVREINSTTTITPGVWTHVMISFGVVTQKIFINGIESGSAVYPENALRNSDPVQIAADQNSSGRYFNGDIDEVNIFDQELTAAQARELMELTRPCPSINLCVSSFPDGLNSHSNGVINFERDAQLFFSPDDVLDAGSVILAGTSSDRTCVSVECQSNGLAVDVTLPQSFPDTSGNTTDFSVSNNTSDSIDATENQYRNITMGNNSDLTIASGFANFYINNFSAGSNAVLRLAGGTYWFNGFSAASGLNIVASGSGTVRVYINNTFSLPENALINSPSAGQQGDASKLLLYSYDSINTGSDSTFSGVIYATNDIEIDNNSNYFGAITGANISIGVETNIFFSPVATADLNYGDLCESASCTLGSFNINQPAYALACPGVRSEISLQAICDDGITIKDDYIGTVNLSTNENSLSEFYASATTNALINSTVFDGSELGTKNVYLFHQNENPSLQVIANDPNIPLTTTSVNATDFRTSGFAVTSPNSFTCGDSTNMTLTAIGQDSSGASCQVLTGFTGNKNIKAWYNVNIDADVASEVVGTNLILDGQGINNQSLPSSNNLNLTFTNGIASMSVAYGNSAQILGINFIHDDAPYDGSTPEFSSLTASTEAFVAYPDKIQIAIDTPNAQCSAQDVSCSKFVAAGAPFSMTLEAQCLGGSVATDYQGSAIISHTLVAPSSGTSGTLSVTGATFAAADNGTVTINNQGISEVGVFDIKTESSSYFGETVTDFTFDNVGRFYPYRFAMLSQNTSNSCGNFSYMSQPGIIINYSLQAQNFNGDLTFNYGSEFALASTGFVAEDDNDGGLYQDRLEGFGNGSWANGIYTHIASGRFSRANLGLVDGPYHDLQVALQVDDGDGADSTLIGLDLKADSSDDCVALNNCNAKLIGNLDVRFGQMVLSNAFGPETFALDMKVQTQYFEGARFVVNGDDSCTSLQVTAPIFSASQWTGNLNDGETTPSFTADIITGESTISFSAAGIGNDGSVIYQYDVDDWLKTENTGNGDYADNPLGIITFGQFRGNDRMIYWRELVR